MCAVQIWLHFSSIMPLVLLVCPFLIPFHFSFSPPHHFYTFNILSAPFQKHNRSFNLNIYCWLPEGTDCYSMEVKPENFLGVCASMYYSNWIPDPKWLAFISIGVARLVHLLKFFSGSRVYFRVLCNLT